MDDADLTQARMEAEEALRARWKPLAVPKVRCSHCLDCGEPIPEARQALGLTMCIECAERAERIASRYRRN